MLPILIRVEENNFEDNMTQLLIHNPSPMSADIQFALLNDALSEHFSVRPLSLTLPSGESHQVTIYAFPRAIGRVEDSLVCCIRENPEPVVFRLACNGVLPELEIDKRVLHFDRALIQR
ncbi:unnamed protein product [Protopolystoma xenopodis]|uniref:Abnormal spindle-like microcephaly-associated protein ASH domain-containing protein n=1 Tax=Protopolystoma xenopodis TaxID=117903 RepID=A0A3S5CSX3_9PLAT|nr:unnamed protein product [Protopolystoma xenopodis]